LPLQHQLKANDDIAYGTERLNASYDCKIFPGAELPTNICGLYLNPYNNSINICAV
jgi:hypothetical protein